MRGNLDLIEERRYPSDYEEAVELVLNKLNKILIENYNITLFQLKHEDLVKMHNIADNLIDMWYSNASEEFICHLSEGCSRNFSLNFYEDHCDWINSFLKFENVDQDIKNIVKKY